ncbi:unnamed protein product [Trichobilharzia regenti]|nr:unnamed protein product [Trichobilharzia regenti]
MNTEVHMIDEERTRTVSEECSMPRFTPDCFSMHHREFDNSEIPYVYVCVDMEADANIYHRRRSSDGIR